MQARIRVLLCDDHAIVRSGLRMLLELDPGLTVVAEAANADEAIAGVTEHQPDVLLLDVAMPGRTGIEALPDLIAAAPETKVLMLSMEDDPVYVRKAFAAGASGYVLKDIADVELVTAIEAVAAGDCYVQPRVDARLAAGTSADQRPATTHPLAPAERNVLRLLTLGRTNQEIARHLGISVEAAEQHRAGIVAKLGLNTRAEIVAFAAASGDIETDNPVPPS